MDSVDDVYIVCENVDSVISFIGCEDSNNFVELNYDDAFHVNNKTGVYGDS